MARRDNRANRDYHRGMEDMRRHMEGEMMEMEDKLKTIAKLMVLKERKTWASEREQLLNDKRMLQRRLSDTEADLNRSNEMMGQSEETSSLNRQLSFLREKHESSKILFQRELKKQRYRAEEEVKKRDEMIVSLQQRVQALEEDTKRTAASANKSSWLDDISEVEALLCEKDKQVNRANAKRIARTRAHIDTLAQLSEAQTALKQSKQQLSEREESHKKELFDREQDLRRQRSEKNTFQKELSEMVESSRKELSVLTENWERRAQRWETEKRELEGTLQSSQQTLVQKEVERTEEIRRLTEENLHLQELLTKKKEKKSFLTSRFKK
ncbi:golgin subfamily A member 6-like protein 22 [Scomber scombrus]|uniref:Golgin subfamily A member 6-like protein 22 n=1 Tax=Scomber scombrus TaxID=13677 RepID=A0AAV1NR04_SCOSC